MTKAAATQKTTTPKDEVQRAVDALNPQRQFIAATANMGWRLAITVVVPLVAGVKLDDHFHSSPSYTLVGLILAATAGSLAVWRTIKEVTSAQQMSSQSKRKVKRNNG